MNKTFTSILGHGTDDTRGLDRATFVALLGPQTLLVVPPPVELEAGSPYAAYVTTRFTYDFTKGGAA